MFKIFTEIQEAWSKQAIAWREEEQKILAEWEEKQRLAKAKPIEDAKWKEQQKKEQKEKQDNAKFKGIGTNGQIFVYDNHIEITRKGTLAHGLAGTRAIPIKNITSIQIKDAGLLEGYLQLGIFGAEARGGQLASSADENTIKYNASNQRDFTEIYLHLLGRV